MRSALRSKLPEAEFQALKEVAFDRLNDLRTEWNKGAVWRKIERFEKVVQSNFTYRLCGDQLAQTIFDRSNSSLQIVRSISRFLKARMAKDLFGSTPWFAARPEGPNDFVEAQEIQKHADWKLRQADYKVRAKQILETALDLGWACIKTTWREENDVSHVPATILFDPTGKLQQQPEDDEPEGDEDEQEPDTDDQSPTSLGKPIVAPSGDYIHQDDDTLEQPDTDDVGQPKLDPKTGEPAVRITFAKAPDIQAPNGQNGLTWRDHHIEQMTRLYYGLDVQQVYYKDILWPSHSPAVTLDEPKCDIITHTMGLTKDEISNRYDPDGTDKDVQAMIERLQNADVNPKTEGDKPIQTVREGDTVNSDIEAGTYKVTECYMRRKFKGEKGSSRVLVVLLEDEQEVLYAEYLSILSPSAQAPIHVVALNKIPGRAFGRGLYDIYEQPAETADRLLNMILFHNAYNSDPLKFWNPSMTKEGESEPNLVIAPGKTYTLKNPQTKAADAFTTLKLEDLDDRTYSMMEMMMQLIQTESGVTNANQGDMSDLPSNNTATGVNSLLESSSVLHFDVLEDLRDEITPALKYAIELIYFRQDQDETYEYLEGDADAVMALSQAAQLAKLSMHVEILLTRSKQQEDRNNATAAIPHCWTFWQAVRTDPESAMHLLPMYIQILRSLGFNNPESYFPSAQELQQMIAQRNAQQQQGQPGQQSPAQSTDASGATDNSPQPPPDVSTQPETGFGAGPSGSDVLAARDVNPQAA